MVFKLTLAAKYAEHKRKATNASKFESPSFLLNKNSTPARGSRFTERYIPYANKARNDRTFKTNESTVSKEYTQLPGTYGTYSRALRPLNDNSILTIKYSNIDLKPRLQTRSYRVEKTPKQENSKSSSRKEGVLNGLWNLAKKISIGTEPKSSELSQLRESTRLASNNAYTRIDIDEILQTKRNHVSSILDDPVDDKLSEIKIKREERDEREKLINALNLERSKGEEMRIAFEKLNLEMRRAFREELRQATQNLLELTKEAKNTRSENTDAKTKGINEFQLYKQNEKFLTEKCEAEAKLEIAKRQLRSQEEEILKLKQEIMKRRLESEALPPQLDNLSLLSMNLIRNDYNHDCSEVTAQLESIHSSRIINERYAKKLILSLGDSEVLNKIGLLRVLSMTFSLGGVGTFTDKETTFLSESEEKIQKCHEYVTDFDIEVMQNPKKVSKLYSRESLLEIQKCFEKAKRVLQAKISRTSSKEKANFEILSSSLLLNASKSEMEDKLSAYVANVRLHSYRKELVSLLMRVIDILRAIKTLKFKIESHCQFQNFEF